MTEPLPDFDTELKRLRWQCRRGMREMDMLLERWLDTQYAGADPLYQRAFVELLHTEDDQLWDWLMGKAAPVDPVHAALIVQIRERFAAPAEH
jgi:antitoxin CptB